MKPKLNKKLTLTRETVRELTDAQLRLAVGGGDSQDACNLSRICHQSRPTYICNTFLNCTHC